MNVIKESNRLIVESKNFDPKQTLECGQVFRFFKNSENDYILYAHANRAHIYTKDGYTVIETDEPDFFENYFDLATDYAVIIDALKKFDELQSAVDCCGGVRILRQDCLETLISFIISSNNNISRIKAIIERLCIKCGTDMGGYYAFPTWEQLLGMQVSDLRACGMGFRAEYIYATVRMIGGDFIERLQDASDDMAMEMLLKLKGIGPKVADCILLFGLGRTGSYPVDTWVFKANTIKELDTPQKVHDYYTARYGALAGYAQQYAFYFKRSYSPKD